VRTAARGSAARDARVRSGRDGVGACQNTELGMTTKADVITYTMKEALAARVDDHVEIAIEAEDGTKIKLLATADLLDALVGDLETILDASEEEAA
jgi:hypothetical protein